VAPGATGELVVTASTPGSLELACLVPGHYEAGMRGSFDIAAVERGAPVPGAGHQHGTHKH
jgi:hypothetical protein